MDPVTPESTTPHPPGHDQAFFESITIPPERSFLLRMDDYPWERCVWNFHPEYEIHLIRRSSGLCHIGDYIGNFEAGQLVMIGSNLPHNWISLSPEGTAPRIEKRDVVLQFDPTRLRQATTPLAELDSIPPLFERAALGIEFGGETAKMGARLLEEMFSLDAPRRLMRFLELLQVLGESVEYRTLASPSFVAQFDPLNGRNIKDLRKALDYIQQHYRKRPRASEIASIVGMSESAFSRFFKAQTGRTFTEHVTRLRLWTACKLLADTRRPITEICYEAGFSNISNFNRAFLKHTGSTPSQYRRARMTPSPANPQEMTTPGPPPGRPRGQT